MGDKSIRKYLIQDLLRINKIDKDDASNRYNILKLLKVAGVNRLIIGQLNINSLRNRIEALVLIIKGNIDILIITDP